MKETPSKKTLFRETLSRTTQSEVTFQYRRGPATSLAVTCNRRISSDPDLKDRAALSSAGYSIRIPATPETVACDKCCRIFRAAGPTGFFKDRPVCDGCLLIGDRQLGMVMTMITVCRYYGGMTPIDDVEAQLHQRELAAFARIYEEFAARHGPARPWSNFFVDETPDA